MVFVFLLKFRPPSLVVLVGWWVLGGNNAHVCTVHMRPQIILLPKPFSFKMNEGLELGWRLVSMSLVLLLLSKKDHFDFPGPLKPFCTIHPGYLDCLLKVGTSVQAECLGGVCLNKVLDNISFHWTCVNACSMFTGCFSPG